MTKPSEPGGIDWSLTTWEGNRRAQLERWASMSLDRILESQEEMAALSEDLVRQAGKTTPGTAGGPPGLHPAEGGKKAEKAGARPRYSVFPRGFLGRFVSAWRSMIVRIQSWRR